MAETHRGPVSLFITRSLEAAVVWLSLGLFKLLPLDVASGLGGAMARAFGPWLPATSRARRSLKLAFPDKTSAEIETIVRAMWENLGRVFAEYPHMHRTETYWDGGRVEVRGAEHAAAMRDDGRPGIFATAHLGNWELAPLTIARQGLKLSYFYRSPNNPAVESILLAMRHEDRVEQIPKGALGARRALKILGQNGHLGFLIDQKMNDGIPIPFFGRPAMTAPAMAQLALRFDCPVCLVRSERLGGARFRVTILPPIRAQDTGHHAEDVARFMTEVTAAIEGWIRERPEQWFWLHRRWGRD
ncbi:MAG: lauroyl acyltransferase [Alphaproteobacteria bacterium]